MTKIHILAVWMAVSLPGSALAQNAATPTVPVPIAPLHTFISPDDYPVEAMKNGEQGTARFRLEIGSDGSVSGCSITQSSGSPSLDETSCRVMTAKARFTPAKNRDGQPVVGTFETSLRWSLGDGPQVPGMNTAATLWINCVVGQASNSVGSDLTPDAILTRSFDGCTDAEKLLAKEMEEADLPGMIPSQAIESLKQQYRAKIVDQIMGWRKLLD